MNRQAVSVLTEQNDHKRALLSFNCQLTNWFLQVLNILSALLYLWADSFRFFPLSFQPQNGTCIVLNSWTLMVVFFLLMPYRSDAVWPLKPLGFLTRIKGTLKNMSNNKLSYMFS